MRYVMLICGEEQQWASLGPAGMEAAMEKINSWYEKWQAEGKILPGGEELDSVETAKTVRMGPDGPVVTDGPYVELKEVVGGIIRLDADNIDEAVAIAAEWPILSGTASIEVRPVMEH